jgi:single-strand DNA-binding protein
MNESMVTFQGWLGADVRSRQAGGATVTSFRVASTPRRLNRTSGEWRDGPTQWYTVNAWRALGEHCATSLRRGDPVVVHGRLTQSTWVSTDGVEMTSLEVDASFVGHDLNRGTSEFSRAGGRAATEPPAEPSAGTAVEQEQQAPEPQERVA